MAQIYHAQAERSGLIVIRRTPRDGAKTIAVGSYHRLSKLVQATSRHGYQGGVYLVPGIPEAANTVDAEDALLDFIDWLASHERDGIEFPLAGQDKANRSTSAERFQRTAEMLSTRGA